MKELLGWSLVWIQNSRSSQRITCSWWTYQIRGVTTKYRQLEYDHYESGKMLHSMVQLQDYKQIKDTNRDYVHVHTFRRHGVRLVTGTVARSQMVHQWIFINVISQGSVQPKLISMNSSINPMNGSHLYMSSQPVERGHALMMRRNSRRESSRRVYINPQMMLLKDKGNTRWISKPSSTISWSLYLLSWPCPPRSSIQSLWPALMTFFTKGARKVVLQDFEGSRWFGLY